MSDERTIIFYFVSGETMHVCYTKEIWQEILKKLKGGWNGLGTITEEYGINFSLVTHYETKE